MSQSAKRPLPSYDNDQAKPESTDFFNVQIEEVESRDMPSLGTIGLEIASLLAALIVLLGILYKH